MRTKLLKTFFIAKVIPIVCIFFILASNLPVIGSIDAKGFTQKTLRQMLGSELFAKGFKNHDYGDELLVAPHTRGLTSMVEQFAFYKSENDEFQTSIEPSEIILVAMVEDAKERGKLNEEFAKLLSQRDIVNPNSDDCALLNIDSYVIFYDLENAKETLDIVSEFFKVSEVKEYRYDSNREIEADLLSLLLSGLSPYGYRHSIQDDDILVKPYVYDLDNIKNFYAVFLPETGEIVASENFVYVVKSDNKSDRNFIIDRFNSEMEEARLNENNYKVSTLLGIGDHVIYYQGEEEEEIVEIIKKFFGIQDISNYVIDNYLDKQVPDDYSLENREREYNIIVPESLLGKKLSLYNKNNPETLVKSPTDGDYFIANEEGKIKVSNLEDGNYYFKEYEELSSYDIVPEHILEFSVNEDGAENQAIDNYENNKRSARYIGPDAGYYQTEFSESGVKTGNWGNHINLSERHKIHYLHTEYVFPNETGIRGLNPLYVASTLKAYFSNDIYELIDNGAGITAVDEKNTNLLSSLESMGPKTYCALTVYENYLGRSVYVSLALQHMSTDVEHPLLHLANKIITITIPVRIKQGVTDEQLEQHMINNERYPNEKGITADVLFGISSIPDCGRMGGLPTVNPLRSALQTGSVTVRKTNSDTGAVLGGAEFTVTGNGINQKITTGSDGQATLGDLVLGTYTITETKAPNGYVLDSPAWSRQFTLTAQNLQQSYIGNDSVRNKPIVIPTGSVTVKKVKSGTSEALSGAKFKITGGSLIAPEIIQTGADGIARKDNLSYGTYTITEEEAPAGYVKGTWSRTFTLNDANQNQDYSSLPVPNNPQSGSVQLIKRDSLSNALLSGVSFQLYRGSTAVGNPQTTVNGVTTWTGLEIGVQYTIRELSAPVGYEMVNGGTHNFTLTQADVGRTIPVTMTNTPKLGSVIVKKVKSGTTEALSGAKFRVSGGGLVTPQVIQTGADGIALLNNLRYGTYTITEEEAPAGYIKGNWSRSFTINDANLNQDYSSLPVPNSPEVGEVQLVKRDSLNNALISGAQFQLYRGSTAIGSPQTTVNGVTSWQGLEVGQYTIRELSAPTGYEMVNGGVQNFTITQADVGKITTVTMTNTPKLGSVSVKKVRTGTTQALAGAKFRITGGPLVAPQIIQTGTDGVAKFDSLRYGTYTITEEEAPKGYVKGNWSRNFTINDNNLNQDYSSLPVPNSPEVSTVKIIKRDADDNSLLSGAKFQLYKGSTPIGEQKTTVNGEATWTGIEIGTEYSIREVNPPAGYDIIGDGTRTFTLTNNDIGKTLEITMLNQPRYGQITVKKQDKEVPTMKLDGAEFTITRGTTTVETLITAGGGAATSKGLRYGTYKIIETKAPEGYESGWTTDFTIDESNEDQGIEIVVDNERKLGSVTIEKVDAENENIKIRDAVFELYNADGSKYEAGQALVYKTGDNGRLTVTGLPWGSYYFLEVDVDGYIFEVGKKYEFTISATNLNVPLIRVTNIKIDEPEIHKEVSINTNFNEDWGNHVDLDVINQVEYWNIETTFGNATDKWESATIEDTFEDIFTIDRDSIVIAEKNGTLLDKSLYDLSVEVASPTDKEQNPRAGQKVVVTFNSDASGNLNYLTEKTYTITVATTIRGDITKAELEPYLIQNKKEVSKNGIANGAILNVKWDKGPKGYSSEVPTVTPPEPKEVEIHKEVVSNEEIYEDWGNHLELLTIPEKHYWNVQTPFGNKTYNFKNVKIEDAFPNIFLIDSAGIKVIDEKGEMVDPNLYSINVEGQNITIEILPNVDDNFNYLMEKIYTTIVPTSIRGDITEEELLEYVVKNKLHEEEGVPNTSRLTVEFLLSNTIEEIESEEPTVIPPTPKEAGIHKEVSGSKAINSDWGNHLDLATIPEKHYWNVKTSFGNKTYNFTTVKISDEFVNIFAINEAEIVIVDEEGNTVDKDTYEISLVNNKLVIEVLPNVDNNFNYLMNKSYTTTIPTSIRGDITEGELSAYIVKNALHPEKSGVPNEADLVIDFHLSGNHGVYVSEKPTVVPPTPEEAGVHKEISETPEVNENWGNELSIETIPETHYWHIQTPLGNKVYDFETIRISDAVADVLEIDGGEIKIVDEEGQVVDESMYELNVVGSEVTIDLIPDIVDGFEHLMNKTFTTTIPANLRGDITRGELEKYIVQAPDNSEEANIGNVAELAIVLLSSGNIQVYRSEIPTLRSSVPEEAEIHQEVSIDAEIKENWGNHIDLSSIPETHYWHIQTPFGNKTYNFETVEIRDTFMDILEIHEEEINIVDEAGQIIDRAMYTIDIDGQSIVVKLLPNITGGFEYLMNKKYTLIVPTNIRGDITRDQLEEYVVVNPLHEEEKGVPNVANLAVNFILSGNSESYESEKPTVVPPTPKNAEIHKEVNNNPEINKNWGNHLGLLTIPEIHYWNIETYFGNQSYNFNSLKVGDEFPDILVIDKAGIVIVDEVGQTVDPTTYTLSFEGQKMTIDLIPNAAGNFEHLVNKTYTTIVPTHIKGNPTAEDLNGHYVINPLTQNDSGIPNESNLTVGFESNNTIEDYLSEKPTVRPPTPEKPEIHEEVKELAEIKEDWGNHLDLVSENQKHYWVIQAEFKNAVYSWKQVRIEDTFVDILHVNEEEIKVIDGATGLDVKDHGILTVDGQKLSFEFKPNNNSFDYLLGKAYVIIVPTTLKAKEAKAKLLGYIVKNELNPNYSGIPNRSRLITSEVEKECCGGQDCREKVRAEIELEFEGWRKKFEEEVNVEIEAKVVEQVQICEDKIIAELEEEKNARLKECEDKFENSNKDEEDIRQFEQCQEKIHSEIQLELEARRAQCEIKARTNLEEEKNTRLKEYEEKTRAELESQLEERIKKCEEEREGVASAESEYISEEPTVIPPKVSKVPNKIVQTSDTENIKMFLFLFNLGIFVVLIMTWKKSLQGSLK